MLVSPMFLSRKSITLLVINLLTQFLHYVRNLFFVAVVKSWDWEKLLWVSPSHAPWGLLLNIEGLHERNVGGALLGLLVDDHHQIDSVLSYVRDTSKITELYLIKSLQENQFGSM